MEPICNIESGNKTVKEKISESIQVKAKYFSKNEFNISNLSTISLYPWKMESGYFGRVKIKN